MSAARRRDSRETRGVAVPRRPEKDLLTAWLLLLLDSDPCHGYGLTAKLEASHLCPDPASMYRALHRLAEDGAVVSSWAQPLAGPRRRVYRLTPAGQRKLDELATGIRVARDHHDRFVRMRKVTRAPPGGDE